MSDWTTEQLLSLYNLAFFELLSQSHQVHLKHHPLGRIQVCSLISIKTGGCPENCRYCSQSVHNKTGVAAQPLMSYEDVIDQAKKAIAWGASRICLGAAWREVRDNRYFEEVLRMVRGIASLGVEVCGTFGLLQEHQAKRLQEAGLFAYNHNLDSSERFYKHVVTTRTYQDRLRTLDAVQKTGLSLCCGGILGMGETILDRIELLLALSQRDPPPDSVPINRLAPVPGTPFADLPKLTIWELARIISVARILLPKAMIRLSCGRQEMPIVEQALCFFAGANSIHIGEKLLTVANTPLDQDREMFDLLGLHQ